MHLCTRLFYIGLIYEIIIYMFGFLKSDPATNNQGVNKALTAPRAPADPARRAFLKKGGVFLAVGALNDFFGLEEANAAPDRYSVASNNISALNAYLNVNGGILRNPKFNDHNIYNDYNKIKSDYERGDFCRDDSKYYVPSSTELKEEEKKRIGVYPPAGMVIKELKSDVLIAGDLIGSKADPDNEGFNPSKAGWAILKKETKILDGNILGKKVRYVYECFNSIYGGEDVCYTPKNK